MDLIYDLIGYLFTAVRRIWTGVLGAVLLAFWVGGMSIWISLPLMALGAFAGTWIGHQLGLLPALKATGDRRGDLLVSAALAFTVVAAIFLFMQVAILLAVLAAVGAVALAWLSG